MPPACDDARMDAQIDGRLERGAATVGPYDYVVGDKKVSVALDHVSATWTGCPDGSDASEQTLQKWFDEELAAQVLVPAVPSSVNWTGWRRRRWVRAGSNPGHPAGRPIATRG